MPKYYIESGSVRLVMDAADVLTAAAAAFQWTCDRQQRISAHNPLAHVVEAERRGWQLADEVWVNERGFGRTDGQVVEARAAVAAWDLQRTSSPRAANQRV